MGGQPGGVPIIYTSSLVLSLIMFSVSFLSLIISNYHQDSNERIYKAIIKNSFHAGWILYFISIIFFGKKFRS